MDVYSRFRPLTGIMFLNVLKMLNYEYKEYEKFPSPYGDCDS